MKFRRILAILTVCVLLCGIVPTGVTAAVDMHPLKNGDFENGSPDQWQAAATVSVSSSAAYEGDYGCVITGDGDWDDLLSQTFTVLPGYSYTLSFWYIAQPMGVSWYLSEVESDLRICRGWAGEKAWTKVEKVFTSTTDTVTLLFRGSGSHIAEKVYLDCVQVTLNPCENHTYDNACDPVCNICDEVRQVGEHLYDHDCDIACNHCGFLREPSGNHTYDFPCATLCNYCGELRESQGEHTYDDVCDEICNFCGETREVPHFYDYPCATECARCGDIRDEIAEELHTYDDIYDADCNHCDHVRVPAPKPMERLSAAGASYSEDVSGVSFRFFLEATDCRVNPDYSYILRSARVCRYNNGVEYKLVQVGAIMSNRAGSILDMEHVDGNRVINIKAGYLCDVMDDALSFVVRIINIPAQGYNTAISARPYYIYSDGKELIVVYGETVSQTYNGLVNGG